MNVARLHRKRVVKLDRPAASIYSSKIIKAGALLADTRAVFAHWNMDDSVQKNLDRISHQNLLGKASRSRMADIFGILRQRYFSDPSVTRALVTLVNRRFHSTALDRVLYFHSVQNDRLLHDVVTEILLPRRARGMIDVDTFEIEKTLRRWREEGKTKGQWSDPTIRRIAQGLLSTLRDFGVLEGTMNKRIAPFYLPLEAFAYILFHLKRNQASGNRLLESPDWNLFFMSREGVERFLFEAHQRELLEYHVAGSVSRLTFPAESLEQYASVLAQR